MGAEFLDQGSVEEEEAFDLEPEGGVGPEFWGARFVGGRFINCVFLGGTLMNLTSKKIEVLLWTVV